MDALLRNRAGGPRAAWATITAPAERAQNFPTEATFTAAGAREFRAVKCRTRGGESGVTTFRVATELDGDELLEGALVATPHHTAGTALHLHPWTQDNHLKVMPGLMAAREGEVRLARTPMQLQMVEQSAAHQRWRVLQGIPEWGLWLNVWVDFHALDPVGRMYATVAWSDRNDPEHLADFEGLGIVCGEPIFLDFARREGYARPLHIEGTGWVSQFSGAVTLGEGEGWHLGGQMLTTPELGTHPDQEGVERGIQALVAAADGGRVLGACTADVWDGHWTASRHVPELTRAVVDDARQELRRFRELMQDTAGYRGRRILGLGESPNQAGDQRDFGSTAGTHVLAGLVDMLDAYKHAAGSDALRGLLHYESDGSPLSVANHPDWKTWEGRTHWSESASPDRLGKRSVAWPIFAGWRGIDRQHRSQNALAADLWLDDDPAVQHMLNHQLTTDLADIKHHTGGLSGARAEGRVAGTFAHFALITDSDQREGWLELVTRNAIVLHNSGLMDPSKAMRVLSVIGPDGRKPIHHPDTGALMPTVSVWEHALAAVGFDMLRSHDLGTAQREVFDAVLRFIVMFGCFQQQDTGDWYVVDDIAYFGGQLPPGQQQLGAWWMLSPRQGGGVTLWTLYAVAIAARRLPEGDGLKARAQACVDALLPASATSIRDGEWRAVFRA